MINLDLLNPNQKEAVLSDAKHLRIVAGAGSGKTRVLTLRIVHLILDEGVKPNKVLAITFTNKAANEMKERIHSQLKDPSIACWISTIHSLCVRILREDILCMGYPRNFTVLDAEDQKSILKEAYKQMDVDRQEYPYAALLDYIANNKYAEITKERALAMAGTLYGEQLKAKIYAYYLERQDKLYALDFDDLLLWTVRMFKRFPEVHKKWAHRFNYIHVDEFQDIDKTQYELIKLLAMEDNYLYVVGDPDQTIYTWRGADVNIIMDFDSDYPDAKTIILNQNYRSTATILNGANSVIKQNKMRVEKELFTQRTDDSKITHYSSASEDYEALWVASKIEELHNLGAPYRNFAILYRSNYLSRAIEKGLLDAHIPYVIYGGVRFYERMEIKDILCYMRMITQADDLAFSRIINKPRRGLGEKTITTIENQALEKGVTQYEVCRMEKFLPARAQAQVDALVALVEKWRKEVTNMPLFKILEKVIDESGYRKMLEEDHETERVENLKELISDVKSFENSYPESTLDEYLQLVSLYGDKDENTNGDAVRLMTVHTAKGLEFDTVFVIGMSDGIFPNERAMADGLRGVEEERRLAYVAFTRAKNKLYLTEAGGFSYVLQKAKNRSRFIDEIDPEYLEHIGANFDYGKPQDVPLNDRLFDKETSYDERLAKHQVNIKWSKGDQVTHVKFGDGIVVKYEAGVLQIAFPYPFGVKKIVANHPSLKKKGA